ncbi:alkene reductase [Alphaproteobacteria bacterium]|nr:alkene reductase [Alphaproteobacteria bacterium]
MTDLFSPLTIGDLTLNNRIIMAPLTRMRSTQPGDIPNELNAQYYAQRATAGLIISEATQISPQGKGYPATPGIHSKEQIAGWKLVTDQVHKENGKIFLQLWHVGRISHPSLQPNEALPVAPSAIPAKNSGTYTATWKPTPILTPRALEESEIPALINDYKQSAINAKEAGFDGVELHSANGYLLDQFLQDGSNHRTDNYGGSIANQARLLFEILEQIIAVWGNKRVGVRLSPYGTFNDMSDSDPIALFSHVLENLEQKQIGYVHLIEPRASTAGGSDKIAQDAPNTAQLFRKKFSGVLISAGGYNPQNAKEVVANGNADAIAFGRYFISNPDLVRRIKENSELTKYDRATFYGGNHKGYTDYPFLS